MFLMVVAPPQGERILLLVMALPRAGVNQVAAPLLPPASSGLLLPGFLALYPAAAAAVLQLPLPLPSAPALFSWSLFSAAPGSASDSSGMWEEASLVHPLLLCSPGSVSVSWFSSTRGLLSPSSLSSPWPRPLPHRTAGPRDLRE